MMVRAEMSLVVIKHEKGDLGATVSALNGSLGGWSHPSSSSWWKHLRWKSCSRLFKNPVAQSNEMHLLCVSALLSNPSKVYCLSFLSALANRLPVSLTSFLNIPEQLAQRTRLQRRNCPRTRASRWTTTLLLQRCFFRLPLQMCQIQLIFNPRLPLRSSQTPMWSVKAQTRWILAG